MSAPLTPAPHETPVRVSLRALPEYEPARLPVPPAPDREEPPAGRWRSAGRRPCRRPSGSPAWRDYPVWEEPEEVTDRLRALLRVVLEVLDGRRPPSQLRNVLDEASYATLLSRSRQAARAGRQHRLRTLHTCRPAAGVIEMCATIETSSAIARKPGALSVAGRVERTRTGAWRCRALHLL